MPSENRKHFPVYNYVLQKESTVLEKGTVV